MQQQAMDFRDLYQRQLESTTAVANALLIGSRRVDQALSAATRDGLADQRELMQTMSEIRDLRDVQQLFQSAFLRFQSAFFRDEPSQAVRLQIELMRIAQDTQQAIVQSLAGNGASAHGSQLPFIAGPMQGLIDLWRNQMTATMQAASANIAHAQQQAQSAPWALLEAAQGAASRTERDDAPPHHARE